MQTSRHPELWSSPVRPAFGARRRWWSPPAVDTRTSWTMAGVGWTGQNIRRTIDLDQIMSYVLLVLCREWRRLDRNWKIYNLIKITERERKRDSSYGGQVNSAPGRRQCGGLNFNFNLWIIKNLFPSSKPTTCATVSEYCRRSPSPRLSPGSGTPRGLTTPLWTTPTIPSCSPRWSPGLGRTSRCWSTVCRGRRARQSCRPPAWGSWSRRANWPGNSWGRQSNRGNNCSPVYR